MRNRRINNSAESQTAAPADHGPVVATSGWFAMLKYCLVGVIIPPFLNYAALQQESRHMSEGLTLYDVGWGQRLNLVCRGQGSPVVILDAPTGMTSDAWAAVQPDIARLTRVCSYDRAGLGFSERPRRNESQHDARWEEFTVERMADDLHRLVGAAGLHDTPLVLVGAEMGSLVARFYAHLYDDAVTDLVLVEPLVETLFHDHPMDNQLWASFWHKQLVPSFQAMQLAAASGLMRALLLVGLVHQPITGELVPEDALQRQQHLLCSPAHLSSVVDEHYFVNTSFSQMSTLRKLKPFPVEIDVTVVTGNYYDEQLPSPLNKAWARCGEQLLSTLHPRARHIVVNGADHHMLYRQPRSLVDIVVKIVKQRRARASP